MTDSGGHCRVMTGTAFVCAHIEVFLAWQTNKSPNNMSILMDSV